MLAITSVIIATLLLYFTGVSRRVLTAFRITDRHPKPPALEYIEDADTATDDTATAPTASEYIESRKQLERIAACIMTCEGYKGDAWGLVRELNTSELIDIINRGI